MTETTNNYVKHIRAERVFGRLNFEVEFKPTINIIHAENGAGKTTLLHILANALSGDIVRFAYLPFKRIFISLADGATLEITRSYSQLRQGSVLNVKRNGQQIPTADIPTSLLRRIDRRSTQSTEQRPASDGLLELTAQDLANANPPLIQTSYFPAFRTMIEAWATRRGAEERIYFATSVFHFARDTQKELMRQGLSSDEAAYQAISTNEARHAFGSFVPTVNYPSPNQIAQELDAELQRALLDVGNTDRELLSKVFIDVMNALLESKSPQENLENPNQLLAEIQKALSEDQYKQFFKPERSIAEVFTRLSDAVGSFSVRSELRDTAAVILDVYRNALMERAKAQESAFSRLEQYLASVNDFLKGKKLVMQLSSTGKPAIGIRFDEGKFIHKLRALSSGERQIITLIYAASRMSGQKVVLVDEPEISLHIDWQRILIAKMAGQLGDRQLIVCTHSPSIGANYLGAMIELKPEYIRTLESDIDDIEDDETDDVPSH